MMQPLSKLGLILNTITDGVIVVDKQGIVLYANQAASLLLEQKDLTGKALGIPLSPDTERQEINLIRASGFAWAEFSAAPILWDEVPGYVFSITDITARKLADTRIANLSRVNSVLSRVNEAIVHTRQPDKMLHEVCRIAVEYGHFGLAWIGVPDLAANELRPVAVAGNHHDFLEYVQVSLHDDERGRGPVGSAWREGQLVKCNDVEHCTLVTPWSEKTYAQGFRSAIALPIKVHGKMYGVFSLYAEQLVFFTPEECVLLQDMVDDVGFALEVAETDAARVQADLALRKSELLFHTLASKALVGIFRTDADGLCEYVNESWCRFAGMQPEDALGIGWRQAVHPDDWSLVVGAWDATVTLHEPFDLEFRFQRPDGVVTWIMGQANAERDESGVILGFVGTITDISTLKENVEHLRQAAAILESTREGVMLTDTNLRVLSVNRAFTQVTGYTEAELLGNRPGMLSSGRHGREFYREMWASIKETGHWQGEIWNRRKNGEIYPELLTISAIKDEAGELVNYVGVFADISKLKETELQLEFLAHHDPLTGLPNRLLMISRMEHAIETAQRNGKLLALLVIDLDRFKDVNDSYGHMVGDELLLWVAERLAERLRGIDTICRLGGDEFTVMLEDISHPEDAARVANAIIEDLSAAWKISGGTEVHVGASVGISLYPTHGANAIELLQQADTALYQAKNDGRGRFKYFSDQLTVAARARLQLEVRLRRALEQQELRVYYQPQVDVASGRIVGAEALVLWLDPEFGMISPVEFIPVAEEIGLISSIGSWVLKTACMDGQRWLKDGLPIHTMAVNLSPRQFLRGDIGDMISRTLEETGFPAALLELELTESALMQREKEAIAILNNLHALGVRIALDDFGTGYSSLAYLKLFPLDVLKIDKSFIDDIPLHRDDMEITATIIAMARTLRLKVLAEGVENADQLAFLKARGCDLYQGYLTSPAVCAEAFEQLLVNQSRM